jgi:hypothetical protein
LTGAESIFKDVVKALSFNYFRIHFFDHDGERTLHVDGDSCVLEEKSDTNQWSFDIYRAFTAVAFPYLIPSTLGFMLVGLGVSTIVPTLYSREKTQRFLVRL